MVQTIFPFALRARRELNEADILYQQLRAQGWNDVFSLVGGAKSLLARFQQAAE